MKQYFSIQINEENKSWDNIPATIHDAKEVAVNNVDVIVGQLAQLVSDATGKAVRMTYIAYSLDAAELKAMSPIERAKSVCRFNGHYFTPQY